MPNADENTGPVLRLFQVKAKPGCADALAEKLATTSIGVVQGQSGNKGYFFGRSAGDGGDWLVFASLWSDLDAVKSRFGAEWLSSHLPEGYAELIDEHSVRHYDLAAGWNVEAV